MEKILNKKIKKNNKDNIECHAGKNSKWLLKMCRQCSSFWYENSWHRKLEHFLEMHPNENISMVFSPCDRCVKESLEFNMQYA